MLKAAELPIALNHGGTNERLCQGQKHGKAPVASQDQKGQVGETSPEVHCHFCTFALTWLYIVYVGIYACTYACLSICLSVPTYVRMCICMYVGMFACMYVRTYVCMHVCTCLCMCVCVDACTYVCTYACMYTWCICRKV